MFSSPPLHSLYPPHLLDPTYLGGPVSPGQRLFNSKHKMNSRQENLTRLTDEECLLTLPYMKGFDLKTKDWCTYIKIKHVYDPVTNR